MSSHWSHFMEWSGVTSSCSMVKEFARLDCSLSSTNAVVCACVSLGWCFRNCPAYDDWAGAWQSIVTMARVLSVVVAGFSSYTTNPIATPLPRHSARKSFTDEYCRAHAYTEKLSLILCVYAKINNWIKTKTKNKSQFISFSTNWDAHRVSHTRTYAHTNTRQQLWSMNNCPLYFSLSLEVPVKRILDNENNNLFHLLVTWSQHSSLCMQNAITGGGSDDALIC